MSLDVLVQRRVLSFIIFIIFISLNLPPLSPSTLVNVKSFDYIIKMSDLCIEKDILYDVFKENEVFQEAPIATMKVETAAKFMTHQQQVPMGGKTTNVDDQELQRSIFFLSP